MSEPVTKKQAHNSRVRSVYFKTDRDLAKVKRAARKARVPLATYIRDAALLHAEKGVAA
jgi:hypothetical protein